MFKNKRTFFERLTGSVSVFQPGPDHPAVDPRNESAPRNAAGRDLVTDADEEGELAVDVFQTANDIFVKAMISGVRPEDLNISISREMVTIRGKREEVETTVGVDYFQKELYWGNFSKTILLPAEVEPEEAEATERHGLLTIRLPKIARQRVQKVKVKSV